MEKGEWAEVMLQRGFASEDPPSKIHDLLLATRDLEEKDEGWEMTP